MRALKIILVSVLSLVVVIGLLVAGLYWFDQWRTDREQAALQAFYTPPATIDGDQGDILRSEPAPDWDVEAAPATRILYVTLETNSKLPRVASGTVAAGDPGRP